MPDETRPWTAPVVADAPADDGERYRLLHAVGAGGMGEVWRAEDAWLQREVVVKLQRPGVPEDAFLHEARICGRIAHPAVVPVLDLGRWTDGRWYLTMPVVEGDPWVPGDGLRLDVDILRRVAEAVAVAHRLGVVHRDLKPGNVLVGELGAVYLVDWGIAAEVGARVGASGTPGWMSPAQARGEPAATDHDLYGLARLLDAVLAASGAAPVELSEPPIQAASAFAAHLRRWLDGDARRERAAALLEDAAAQEQQWVARAAEAESLRRRADGLLDDVPVWGSPEDKAAGWALQDAAAELDRLVVLGRAEQLASLQAARLADPDAEAPRLRLAELHRADLERAEAVGEDGTLHEILLRQQDPGRHRDWLGAGGAVSLVTTEPVAVWARPLEVRGRRTVPGEARYLGTTPLREVPLPAGSWLLELRGPVTVRYQVWLRRRDHWDGRGPDGVVVPIAVPSALGADDCYVPAGWTWVGGDPEAPDPRPRRRVWVDGVVVRRFPVTNADYAAWLEARLARGEPVDALLPRTPDGQGATGAPIVRVEHGRVVLPDGSDGARLRPDAPVVLVDAASADAYAAAAGWRLPTGVEWEKAARGVDGRPLPWGSFVDPAFCCMLRSHRGSPEPAVVGSYAADVSPYGVRDLAGNARDWCADAWHRDDADIVDDGRVLPLEGPLREIRGGSWLSAARLVRSALRSGGRPNMRKETVGFRLARSL
jgi:serine/threonine-protein kinase